jgi:hypothetical protein
MGGYVRQKDFNKKVEKLTYDDDLMKCEILFECFFMICCKKLYFKFLYFLNSTKNLKKNHHDYLFLRFFDRLASKNRLIKKWKTIGSC